MQVYYWIRSHVREWLARFQLWLTPPPDDPNYEGDEDIDPDEHKLEED